jgi:acetyl esterase/lipase
MQLAKFSIRKYSELFLSVILVVAFCVCSFGQQTSTPDTTKTPPATATPDANTAAPAPAAPSNASGASGQPKPSVPPGFDPVAGMPLYETIQEDWSSLQIGTSKLNPEAPLVAQTDEQDTFVRTLVQVKWRPGDPIDLWIMMPKGIKKPPVVLYLYGFTEGTDRFKSDGWVRRATAGGVAAVGFVSALTGPRFHDRPMKQWFVSELQESVGSTVHDVKFILDYLAQRGDLDMDRVGMFGEGSGGTIAILAAAADRRIKAVDTLEPWGDWPDFLAKSSVVQDDPNHADYTKRAFLKKVAPLDPVKWLPTLKIPIRIQQIKDFTTTPMECKESIQKAAPKQAVVSRFETAEVLGDREAHGILFDWVKVNLPKAPKPEVADAKVDGAASEVSSPHTSDGSATHQ